MITVTIKLWLPEDTPPHQVGNDISWLLRSKVCPDVEHECVTRLRSRVYEGDDGLRVGELEIDDPVWRK